MSQNYCKTIWCRQKTEQRSYHCYHWIPPARSALLQLNVIWIRYALTWENSSSTNLSASVGTQKKHVIASNYHMFLKRYNHWWYIDWLLFMSCIVSNVKIDSIQKKNQFKKSMQSKQGNQFKKSKAAMQRKQIMTINKWLI